jgi:hypothetical protein
MTYVRLCLLLRESPLALWSRRTPLIISANSRMLVPVPAGTDVERYRVVVDLGGAWDAFRAVPP